MKSQEFQDPGPQTQTNHPKIPPDSKRPVADFRKSSCHRNAWFAEAHIKAVCQPQASRNWAMAWIPRGESVKICENAMENAMENHETFQICCLETPGYEFSARNLLCQDAKIVIRMSTPRMSLKISPVDIYHLENMVI